MFGAISRFDGEDPEKSLVVPGQQPAKARDRDLQRANGEARLVFSARGGRTYAADLYQRSPLRVLLPNIDGGVCSEAVLSNTSGGIAGGDAFTCRVSVENEASIAVTTQAAEKIYRALNAPASIETHLGVSAGGKLAWLPQETILFDGARLRRRTHVHLSGRAELIALEWLVLGRAARGETMSFGELSDGWTVRLDGRLIWADTFRIPSEAWSEVNRAALLDGCTAFATAIAFGTDMIGGLDGFRTLLDRLPCRCGVTPIAGLLVCRFASADPAHLRASLKTFLQETGGGSPTGLFRIPKMWSC